MVGLTKGRGAIWSAVDLAKAQFSESEARALGRIAAN
jgi:hypothetical protein